MNRLLHSPTLAGLLAALLYLVFGGAWILFSDRAVAELAADVEQLAQLQLYKGWFYVFITGVIAFALVRWLAAINLRLRRARAELRLAAVAFDCRQPILITDREARIVRANRAYCELTGYAEDEILGRNPRMFASGRQDEAFYQRMWRQLLDEGHWEGELLNRRRDGSLFPQWQAITAVHDPAGAVTHFVAQVVDRSEHESIQRTLHRLEYFDAVTGLPNRKQLLERLSDLQTVHPPRPLALVLVDLWRFSDINKALGPDTGDRVLRQSARVLTRLDDADGHNVARIASDVFALVVEGRREGDDGEGLVGRVTQLAERVRQGLLGIHVLKGTGLSASVNLGVSMLFDQRPAAAVTLAQAEAALDDAKARGPGTLRVFEPAMQASAEARAALAAELRAALDTGGILAHFQPKCDVEGRIIGAEALARWPREDGTTTPPSQFVPLAESMGLDEQLGECMLRQAARAAKAFAVHGATLPVAVNITSHHLMAPDFVNRVAAIVQEAGVAPEALVLEVTESQLMDDFEGASDVLEALRRVGIRVSIDDFGTGYSSLSYLKMLPVDELKIDGGFVREAERGQRDQALLRAIITMGHSLGLEVVAEGIETREQAEVLKALGCRILQGYLFGRPVPFEVLDARLREASATA
ncbi:MAG: putative bifunctional diguanylate cyclase/phosphodiesterase [Lysobacteraceae bacterium]